MKIFLLLLPFAWPAAPAFSQTIEFFTNEVRGLDRTFVLHGTIGQATAAKSLWLSNRTRQTLRVYARPHLDGDALYFTNNQETTSREYSLEIAPGTSGTLQLFGFLAKGNRRTSRGHLALAATSLKADGSKGVTSTVKLPVTLHFEAGRPKPAAKPAPAIPGTAVPPAATIKPTKPFRYDVITHKGVPMRWHLHQLPLKVYSAHTHTGDTAAQYAAVVRRTIEVWNNVGRENGMGRDFFRIVQKPGQADLRLDWTGAHLLPGTEGTTHPSDGRIGMWPLAHYRGLGQAGETLLHELCHMLGVVHSMVWEDIMFEGMRNRNPDLSKLGVTTRDKQILGWLYSQTKYVPFHD